MSLDDVLKETRRKMEKAIDAIHHEMGKIRTGKANPALLDDLRVEYYGTPTPLKQIASITAPEPRVLMIQPWDANALSGIERAISKSDLGLPPNNDGKVIRLNIPELTEERRKELVRVVHRRGEDGRVAVRNLRKQANDEARKLEKEKEISEDDLKRGLDEVQKLTDEYVKKVDEIVHHKEKVVMEV